MSDEEERKPKIIRTRKPINRKTKKHIVFDADARREFLTGFKKRKRQRQKQAQEELVQKMKDEKKRIRDEARNLKAKFPLSHRPIPELEEMLTTSEHTLDFPEHSVSIKELTAPVVGNNEQSEEEEEVDGESESVVQKSVNLKKEIRKMAAKQYRKSKIVQQKIGIERIRNKNRAKRRKKSGPKDKRSKHRGRTQPPKN